MVVEGPGLEITGAVTTTPGFAVTAGSRGTGKPLALRAAGSPDEALGDHCPREGRISSGSRGSGRLPERGTV
jgi:hypothetical protein